MWLGIATALGHPIHFAVPIVGAKSRLWRGTPGWDIPNDTSEALQLEGFATPPSTRLAASIEGTKTGIYGTLVGFWAEFVSTRAGVDDLGGRGGRGGRGVVIDGPIFPEVGQCSDYDNHRRVDVVK